MKIAKKLLMVLFLFMMFFTLENVYAKSTVDINENIAASCVYTFPKIRKKVIINVGVLHGEVFITYETRNISFASSFFGTDVINLEKYNYFNIDSFVDANKGHVTCPVKIYADVVSLPNFDGNGGESANFLYLSDSKSTLSSNTSALPIIISDEVYLNTDETEIISRENGENISEDKSDLLDKKNDAVFGCSEKKQEHLSLIQEHQTKLDDYYKILSKYVDDSGNVTSPKEAEIWLDPITKYVAYNYPVNKFSSIHTEWYGKKGSYVKNCGNFTELDALESTYQKLGVKLDQFRSYAKEHPDEFTDYSSLKNNLSRAMKAITAANISIGSSEVSCDFIDSAIWKEIRWVLTVVQVSVPILILILGSVDFGKAVLMDDQDALKKATSKFVKRLIIGVAIFLLPILLQVLLNFVPDAFPEIKGSLCKDDLGL